MLTIRREYLLLSSDKQCKRKSYTRILMMLSASKKVNAYFTQFKNKK